MIAYEIFDEDRPSDTQFSLRLLRDVTIESVVTQSVETETLAAYGLSDSEFSAKFRACIT